MKKNHNFLKAEQTEAIALTYHPSTHAAPVVVAKGKGKVAENIISTAKDYGIPIQEDAALVELLAQLNVNETIPEQLFVAVAEIFAFIYKIDQAEGEKRRKEQ